MKAPTRETKKKKSEEREKKEEGRKCESALSVRNRKVLSPMVMQLDKSAFSIGIDKFLGLTEKKWKGINIYNKNIYVRSKTKGDKNKYPRKGGISVW